MHQDILLVFSTCPERATAERIATILVERKLAACVSVGGAVQSHYVWKDQREVSEEIPLIIKTSRERYAALEKTLVELHPYELPEIVAVPVERGLPAYLDWVQSCTV